MIQHDKLAMLLSMNEKFAAPIKLSNAMTEMSAKVQLLTKHATRPSTLLDLLPNHEMIQPKVSMLLGMHTAANQLRYFSDSITYLEAHSKVKSILGVCFKPTLGELLKTSNIQLSNAGITIDRLSDLSDIGNVIRAKLRPIMPDDAMTALQSIILKQREYIEPFIKIRPTLQSVYANEFNSLQFALKDISNQIIASATLEKNWEVLKQFEDFTTEVSDYNHDSTIATKADLENLLLLITSLVSKVENLSDNVNKLSNSIEAKIFKWIAIISFLLLIKDQILLCINSDTTVTKKEFSEVRKDVHSLLTSNGMKNNTYRALLAKSKVRTKPKTKSYILANLPKGFPVLVLDTNHKWAYISYLNPEDNVNQTGWILKKNLGAVVEY